MAATQMHGVMKVSDTGTCIFTPDPVVTPPIEPPPVQPPPVNPPPIISGGVTTVTVKPGDDLSNLTADTVVFRGGTYLPPANIVGLAYGATLPILVGGTSARPRTFQAYPGELPIISGKSTTYAIRVGDVRNDVGVPWIIIDGLLGRDADRNGLMIYRGTNCVARNFQATGNSPGDYRAGIEVCGGDTNLIDSCRCWGGAYGAEGTEVTESDINTGPRRLRIVNSLFWQNNKSSNAGNSCGAGIRFGDQCEISDCIMWGNSDSAINGLGSTRGLYLRNIAMNSWYPVYVRPDGKVEGDDGANLEGFKACVRGGGLNLWAGCLSIYNNANGIDTTESLGDIIANCTFFGNNAKGLLMEGERTYLWNVISEANQQRLPQMRNTDGVLIDNPNLTDNYPQIQVNDASRGPASIAPGSGWCITTARAYDLQNFNSPQGEYNLPGMIYEKSAGMVNPNLTPRRDSVTQDDSPESLFGSADIGTVRKWFTDRFALSATSPARGVGRGVDQMRASFEADRAKLAAAFDARITWYRTNRTDPQGQEAVVAYTRNRDAILAGWSPDWSAVKDLSGAAPTGAMGAIQ